MKIAVVGSRAFRDWAHFSRVMRDAIKRGDIIISGAARGADAMAKRWADENDIEIIEYPADWSKGLDAGFVRNRQIIGECDQCIAFWDHKSKGTEHSINLCRAWRKPVRIEYFTIEPDLNDLTDLFS